MPPGAPTSRWHRCTALGRSSGGGGRRLPMAARGSGKCACGISHGSRSRRACGCPDMISGIAHTLEVRHFVDLAATTAARVRPMERSNATHNPSTDSHTDSHDGLCPDLAGDADPGRAASWAGPVDSSIQTGAYSCPAAIPSICSTCSRDYGTLRAKRRSMALYIVCSLSEEELHRVARCMRAQEGNRM